MSRSLSLAEFGSWWVDPGLGLLRELGAGRGLGLELLRVPGDALGATGASGLGARLPRDGPKEGHQESRRAGGHRSRQNDPSPTSPI